jgi:hypothetical protein
MNAEVGPAVVLNERDYGAARMRPPAPLPAPPPARRPEPTGRRVGLPGRRVGPTPRGEGGKEGSWEEFGCHPLKGLSREKTPLSKENHFF